MAIINPVITGSRQETVMPHPEHCKYIVTGRVTTSDVTTFVIPKGEYAWDGNHGSSRMGAMFAFRNGVSTLSNAVMTTICIDSETANNCRLIRSYSDNPRTLQTTKKGACAMLFDSADYDVLIYIADTSVPADNIPESVAFDDFAELEAQPAAMLMMGGFDYEEDLY